MVKAAHNPPTNREPYTVEYAYDHQGRMVWKTVSTNAVVLSTRNLVWDNYNIVAETIHSAIPSFQSSTNLYVWGLDLSEQSGAGLPRHSAPGASAGGVGGLLAEVQDGVPYFAAYDANGNVTEYVNENGNVRAHYEYSPFGETVVQSGPMADSFTHRFSTKPWCAVTGLSEYLFRKYSPGMGRFLSRDPIGDEGGILLYGSLNNNPIHGVDFLGLFGRSQWYNGEYFLGHDEFTGGTIFDYNKEDDAWDSKPWLPWSTWRHFRKRRDIESDLDVSVEACDKNKTERLLHQWQDTYVHWDKKSRWWKGGHVLEDVLGKFPDLDNDAWSAAESTTDIWVGIWKKTCCKCKAASDGWINKDQTEGCCDKE